MKGKYKMPGTEKLSHWRSLLFLPSKIVLKILYKYVISEDLLLPVRASVLTTSKVSLYLCLESNCQRHNESKPL